MVTRDRIVLVSTHTIGLHFNSQLRVAFAQFRCRYSYVTFWRTRDECGSPVVAHMDRYMYRISHTHLRAAYVNVKKLVYYVLKTPAITCVVANPKLN